MEIYLPQSAGAVQYTEWTSAEGSDPPPTHRRVSWYDTKQLDGEVPVMLEFWGSWCTLLLPSVSGPLWSEVVATDMVLSMSQIELLMLNWIVWNRIVYLYKNGFGIK